MVNYQSSIFVGIVEHIDSPPCYDYCDLNIQSGGMGGYISIQVLGEMIASEFGENFLQQITYEPPFGIDTRGTERGLCPRKYHKLSVLEQARFEESVLETVLSKR